MPHGPYTPREAGRAVRPQHINRVLDDLENTYTVTEVDTGLALKADAAATTTALATKAAQTALDATNTTVTTHTGQISAVTTTANRVKDRALDMRDYGAIGGGLGTTIAAAGGVIATIRTDSGQAWLNDTDSMDLAAFYLAQAAAETTGRSILFPKDDYVFTAPAFLHAGVHVDLGGSTITGTAADASRFVRGNRVFLLGILAREDFDRFDTQGWTQTADSAAQDATTLTNATGALPAVGDFLMIRTAGSTSSPTLPDYVTWNEVSGAAGTTVTLKYPLERAVTSVEFVNYNVIATLKSALVGTGEPHRYYCCANASLRNGTVRATDGPAFEPNAMLNTVIDIEIDAPKGQGVYGNGMNRSRIRVRGVCGGPKGPIELGIGSALTTIDADLRYSGIDSDSAGSVSGSYPHIQLGEYTESCIVRGRLDMGAKPANQGVTTPTGNRNTVDVELVGRGITANAVVFASNAGTGNKVHGRYEVSSAADYCCVWSSGTGTDNWLENARFVGTPGTNALRFSQASAGGARGVVAPSGQLVFDSTATGNPVMDSHIAAGITSAGPPDAASIPRFTATAGSYPPLDRVTTYAASTTLFARDMWGTNALVNSAGAIRTMTLPASKVGMTIRFQRSGANAVRLDPNGTETIGSGAAGKYLSLDSDNGSVELSCLTAGAWVVGTPIGTVGFEP